MYANGVIVELKQLQSTDELLMLCGFILVLGLIIGMVSTYRAVKKYLRMSLDELY
jgi:cell division transport system permease protein